MTATNGEPDGGDPPCWAHLFDDVPCPDEGGEDDGIVDLALLARTGAADGTAWGHQSEDLNANLLVFAAGGGVAEHVNAEVDVLLVGVAGEGVVDVDGARRLLRAGQALVIPKGARRSTRSLGDRFAYLSCHRRRPGLLPSSRPRSAP